MSRATVGTIYLLHFDEAIADHARHYLGWASDLDARLEAHREGRGARLMEVVKERDITWHVSRTWEGTRDREPKTLAPDRSVWSARPDLEATRQLDAEMEAAKRVSEAAPGPMLGVGARESETEYELEAG